jgi:SNF2 family DNA or RNA helicase
MWNDTYSLYPYQKGAAEEMFKSNVLLAYEMGTGKTPTTLYAIEKMRHHSGLRQAWVVVPSSLKYQWKSEIEKFTDQAVIVIEGTLKQRKDQYWKVADEEPGYIVLSYDSVVRDWDWIKPAILPGLRAMVLDEATAIKAFDTKRSKHLKKVAFRFQARFALTGTPIENGKLEELFSIMQWVDDDVLGRWKPFEDRYIRRHPMGWIEGYRNVGELHERLTETNAMLRATHSQPEVAKYLPKVVERPPIRVRLSNRAKKINDWIGSSVLSDLDEFSARMASFDFAEAQDQSWNHPDGRMMAKITVLRQFLSRPESVLASASPFVDQLIENGLLTPGSQPSADKFNALTFYLDEFLVAEEANKAVVFCSFVNTASAIHRRYGQNSALLHGAMSPKQRHAEVERFKNDPNCCVFVSTDAGGYGLDLPQANLLINYDLPWSPGVLAQRNARIKRASSEWPYVVIQNIVCEGTIEERMLEMLRHKMSVADATLDGTGMDETGQLVSDLDSLRAFLQSSTQKELDRVS